MARALWKGHVTFGLVNIPVELHPAVEDNTPRFRMLHKTDLSPISLERVCQTDGQPVSWGDLVKGFEIEPGRFVVVTQDDFKTAAVEKSRSIEILDFVDANEIDGRFFETPYWLHPSKGGESSYALLARALKESGRAGIAKYVMRQREHLSALLPVRGCLVVSTMRFEEDLVELPHAPRAKVSPQEMKLADQLISSLAGEWNPDAYHDEYVPALMKVIKAKAAGKKMPAVQEKAMPPTKVVDLVERLRESLAAAQRAPRRKRAATSTSTASRRPGGRGRRRVA